MKTRRKLGISNATGHPQIRKFLGRGGFDRVPISYKSSSSRVSDQTPDMSRIKRVRFSEPEIVSEGGCWLDASVDSVESSIPQSFDRAKTAEYQHYQELRQAAGHKVRSLLPDKQDNHLNNIKANNSDRFKTSASKKSGCSFHLCIANKRDSNLKITDFSTGVDDSETSEYQYIKKFQEDSFHNHRFHPPNARDSHLKKAASNCTVELQHKHGELFSRKRQKLLKLAAEVLSLDVDEFSSNRSNLLAKFLQRLGIEQNANNRSGLLRLKQMELDNRLTMLSYPESSTHVQEVPHATKTYFMPSPIIGIMGKGLHESWVEANNLILPPGNDLDGHHCSAVCDCSCWVDCSHEASQLYRTGQSDNALDGGKITNWQTDRTSILGGDLSTESLFSRSGYFLLENCPVELDHPVNKILPSPGYSLKHAIAPSNSLCFRELDEICGLHELQSISEKSPLLLDWKADSLVKETGLFVSCQRMSEALNPMVYDNWNSNSNLDEFKSCYPSFFPKKQSLNSTLQEFLVDWVPNSAAGKCIISDTSFLLEESVHYPLLSSNANNYLASTEGLGLSDNYKESDHHIFVHKSFQGKLYSSLGDYTPPLSPDLNVRWKSLSPNVYFNDNYPLTCSSLQFHNNEEEMSKYKQTGDEFHSYRSCSANESSIYDIVPFSQQLSPKKESLFPLLLDRSSWDHDDKEII